MKLLNIAIVKVVQCAMGGVIGGLIMFFVSGYSLETLVRLSGFQGDTGSCILIALCFYAPCGMFLGALSPLITQADERVPADVRWNDGRYVGAFALISWLALVIFSAITAHDSSYTLPVSMWPVALWAAWCIHCGWPARARR